MQNELIAVSDQSVENAGEITYCRITGSIDLDRLAQVWSEAGLPEYLLPKRPSAESSLKTALQSVKCGKRQLLRPLQGITGFALVDETAFADNLDYDTEGMLRAKVVKSPLSEPTLKFQPEDHPLVYPVRQMYERVQNHLQGSQVGAWLWNKLAFDCRAVSLRETGGVYFIPRSELPRWRKFTKAIQQASDVKIFAIPAVCAEEAVDAVFDALMQEVNQQVATIGHNLTSAGKRALSTRRARSELLKSKVEHYESLFSRELPNLKQQIDDLTSDISTASIMLMGECK